MARSEFIKAPAASTFVASDVGRLISIGDGHAKITAYSSGTSVTATTTENFANTNANANGDM